jgi:carbonic anhydrase
VSEQDTSSATAGPQPIFPVEGFADVLSANAGYAQTFQGLGLGGRAAKGLAIVTCMDSRIDPLPVLGMRAGDVKILRNAGARVTDDVLRTLVLATYLLEVNRVLVMPHTRCRMVGTPEDEIHQTIATNFGVDTSSMEFRTVRDQEAALKRDLRRVRSFPLLPDALVVGGAVYDVDTGRLRPVDG